MLTLKGDSVYLRALESEDLDFVYSVENNPVFWSLSQTLIPYSKYTIAQYISNAKKDIYEAKQLRLLIADFNHCPIGLIDLYDFDSHHRRAGIGIVISESSNRSKGYGQEALDIFIDYAFKYLNLNQLYCDIIEDNLPSINLFKKNGFTLMGIKRRWHLENGNFKDVHSYQKFYNVL